MYCFVLGACWSCKQPFTFNPNHVPSIRIKGVREPICRNCMERANAKRKQMGEPPHPIHPEAYESENCSEI